MSPMTIDDQERLCQTDYATLRKLTIKECFSNTPTNTVCVLNLGFGGDQPESLEKIQAVMAPIIGAERVIANKNWPYLYLAFPRSEFATNAKEELNRHSFAVLGGKTLFAQYVAEPENAYA